MGFLSKLFGSKPVAAPDEHAVIVHFDYGSTDLAPLFALERRLDDALKAAGAGEVDGNEVATDGSDGYLYLYGPEAGRLFEVARPHLEAAGFMRGARARIRYGKANSGAREEFVELGA